MNIMHKDKPNSLDPKMVLFFKTGKERYTFQKFEWEEGCGWVLLSVDSTDDLKRTYHRLKRQGYRSVCACEECRGRILSEGKPAHNV
ncbi:hypothetical protein AB0I72_27430 [Nocardiopsis sp. NPDC049922]|uniref:hypothetical protein n=1 Tax=Nocardiopsis sp. NPDC049922 TaxID=3155157 RepID=UPI0033FD941F